jgi:hypothetical protein
MHPYFDSDVLCGCSGLLAVLCSTIHRASWLGLRGRGLRPSGFFFGFFFLSAMWVLYGD